MGINSYFKDFKEYLQLELKEVVMNCEDPVKVKEIQTKYKYLTELETLIINQI